MEVVKTRKSITTVIQTVAEKQGLKNHVITDVKTNQKGEGYLGEIFMVTVKDPKNGKQVEMVIKAAFIDKKVREIAPIRMSFQNEIYFYTDVLPLYNSFEKERGVRSIEYAPKCLSVSVKEEEEILALENLKVAGFEIFDKTLTLDDDHVKLIFKTYGRLHGYSFALRDQKPDKYKQITKNIHNLYEEFMKAGFFAQHLTEISKLVQNTLIPEEDDEIITKYQKYTENIANIFNDIVKEEVDYPAILHGDCWSNNMMFKYEETVDGRKPTDMRLIDWQLLKVGSPVCDLSYCLYSGASKEAFDNLQENLQIYYESFSSFVQELGSDPEKLFPLSVLKEHWKKYSKFGMIMAFSILKMKLSNKEDLVDLTDGFEMNELVDAFTNIRYNEEDYSKRIRGLLCHMSEIEAL